MLFKEILSGNQKEAVGHLRELIDNGLDAKNFLNDILELLYLFNRRINLGPIENDLMISESEIEMINQYAKNVDNQDLGIFWQITIKTMEDIRIVGNENLALEMYVMQLMHVKSIGQEDFKSSINQESISTAKGTNMDLHRDDDDNKVKSLYKNQLKNTEQVKENLAKQLPLKNKNILITAGPTFEAIDPVRFIGNQSSGKMGFSIAEAAANAGANVTLVAGPTNQQLIYFNKTFSKTSQECLFGLSYNYLQQLQAVLSSANLPTYRMIETLKFHQTEDCELYDFLGSQFY
mgnify:CR=1 FL=1